MILVLDNYDSFTWNLVQELERLSSQPVETVRNDHRSVAELLATPPRAIVISPGPGRPSDAGVTLELIRAAREIPLLGVCLGHQALAEDAGGEVVRAAEPVHGKTSPVRHRGDGLFAGLPDPFDATRYHSLVVRRETCPDELEITAWGDDGTVMGLAARDRPHHGVQFHPESYLTRCGPELLANFLRLAEVPLR